MTAKRFKILSASKWLKPVTVIACLVFCVLLQSSTTHYAPMLRYYLLQEDLQSSYKGLWPAAREGSAIALDALVKLAAVNEDIYWLEKAASLNDLSAQLTLADLSDDDKKIYWWSQAAINGHGPSQFELSLLVDSPQERVRYLEQAAFNEHAPAIIALSKYYYERDDSSNALRWLKKAAMFDENSTFKLARMLWKQGFEADAENAFLKAAASNRFAEDYVSTLRSSTRENLSILTSGSPNIADACAQQLQFVATSLDTAVQANKFKRQYENDRRLRALPICISPIVWLAENQLHCKFNNSRKECDISDIAATSFIPSYTHLVFFLDEGKAYVHNGAMYLDEADTYSVFVHELAHFVGFVDEYAVSSHLAEQYCFSDDAPNLVAVTETELYEHEDFQLWQVYYRELMMAGEKKVNFDDELVNQNAAESVMPSLEVSASRTCSSLKIKAFKPAKGLTFMEYHDTQNIPPIYLLMWKDLLNQGHHSVAVSALFKDSAVRANNQLAMEYWSGFY